MKVFSTKIVFFTNLRKFSPTKVFRSMAGLLYTAKSAATGGHVHMYIATSSDIMCMYINSLRVGRRNCDTQPQTRQEKWEDKLASCLKYTTLFRSAQFSMFQETSGY